MKTCSKCRNCKPKNEFTKLRSSSTGLAYACKACDAVRSKLRKRTPKRVTWAKRYNQAYYLKHREQILERVGHYQRENPEKVKRWCRQRLHKAHKKRCEKWGLTAEQYQKMLEAQNGCCAICFQEMNPVCFDHCHLTNKFRGFLCKKCNVGIGNLKDSVDIAFNAWQYLKQFSESKKRQGNQTKPKIKQ